MPKVRQPCKREVTNLLSTGGQSGRNKKSGCDWRFGNLNRIITPNEDLNEPECDESSMVSSSSDTTLFYSTASSVSHYAMNTNSTNECESESNVRATNEDGGNRLINLPSLQSVLYDVTICKACATDAASSDMDDFLLFCNAKRHCVME